MKYFISLLFITVFIGEASATPIDTAFLNALHYGMKIIKAPDKGRLDKNVTLGNPNRIELTMYLRPKSRENDISVIVTSRGKKLIEITDHFDTYIGTVKATDFPVRVDVRYKDGEDDWIDFTVELVYPNYGYDIEVRKE